MCKAIRNGRIMCRLCVVIVILATKAVTHMSASACVHRENSLGMASLGHREDCSVEGSLGVCRTMTGPRSHWEVVSRKLKVYGQGQCTREE